MARTRLPHKVPNGVVSKYALLRLVLAAQCPTCGAAPGEKCELSTGQPRTDPHRDRRSIAKD